MADQLPGPYEYLDLPDGGVLEVHPTDWAYGEAVINPTDGRPPRLIPVLRIHVAAAEKATMPLYWDVTAKTIQPTLVALLPGAIARGQRIRMTKYGVAPQARFSVEVI